MELRTEVLRDPGALEETDAAWRDLWARAPRRVVFLHPLWARCWWRHYGQEMELFLVLVWDQEDRLAGLAPLCRARANEGSFGWIGGQELSDILDFLIAPGLEAPVMTAMERVLRRILGPRGELDLHFVPQESHTLEEVNEMLLDGWDVRIELEEFSPWVSLPGSWEDFLGRLSGHHRHEIRRKMGKAQRELAVSFRVVEDESLWSRAMEHFFRLHRLSQPQKAAFMDERREAFFLEAARLFWQEGVLRLTELLLQDGAPIASALCFVQGDTWALYNSGFDPGYRQYSPGIVHVAHTIRRAIEENLGVYDFLRGREIYKYDFGAWDRQLFRVRLSPRAREGAR